MRNNTLILSKETPPWRSGHLRNMNYNHAHIVFPAMLVGEQHKMVCAGLRVANLKQRSGDFDISDHSRQSIGTKQHDVMIQQQVLRRVQFDFFLRSYSSD